MSPRRLLLFATLFTVIVVAAFGTFAVFSAKLETSPRNTWLRVPMLAAVRLCSMGLANQRSRWREAFDSGSELPAASYVPIQFKDPKSLGLGKLLVASRDLRDPNFAETVVLLVHYDAKGVLGLVLNRRTDVPISQVFDLKAAKDLSDPVYLGGPVGTSNVFALYQSAVKLEKAENVFGGVYLISDRGLFDKILSGRPDSRSFHVYVGYAGWTEDQLRAEVQTGAWFVFPADAITVFNSNPDSLWLQMIRKTEMQWTKAEPMKGISQSGESGSSRRLLHIALPSTLEFIPPASASMLHSSRRLSREL
jgi:putative AlgH/UPF0301 family transcriptional regulator